MDGLGGDGAAKVGRRDLCVIGTALLMPAIARKSSAAEAQAGDNVSLYAAAGQRLDAYRPDLQAVTLTRRTGPGMSVDLPAAIQYIWRHPRLPLMYVAFSDRGDASYGGGHSTNTVHGVQPVRLGEDGSMTMAGPPLRLDNRPINLTVDGAGKTLLVAFNIPSELRVFPLDEAGAIGARIEQAQKIDGGVYAHQVRVAPDDKTVVLVTRGNDPAPGKLEDPGGLKVFSMTDGQLRPLQPVAPNGGYGFGPRHLDFAKGLAWVYVSLERENAVDTFGWSAEGIRPMPQSTSTTLYRPPVPGYRQLPGPIHVSSDGRFLYVGNRADTLRKEGGRSVFAGGENSIAVFSIDQASGQPSLIQTADIGRFHPRTFSIHPRGGMLVTATIVSVPVAAPDGVHVVPAGLTVFRVREDGTLLLNQQVDVPVDAGELLYWCGMIPHLI